MKTKIIAAVILAMLCSVAIAASKKDFSTAIESKYQLTTRSMLTGQVKKPGTVLYVSKSGLNANTPRAVMKATIIRDGEVEQLGGGSFIPGKGSGRTLNPGDEMYLYSYQVKKDSVIFLYGTVQSYETEVRGSTKLQPYQLALQFQYSDGLESVDTQRVLDDMSAYFSTVKEAASSESNTLSLGQTPDEVLKVMGPPKRKVDLGSKMIFTYDDLKVIFQDGTVTDVQ